MLQMLEIQIFPEVLSLPGVFFALYLQELPHNNVNIQS
jgi:hypothetical protein